jgi:hypothetical protein
MTYDKQETTGSTPYAPPFSILASIRAPTIHASSFVEIASCLPTLMIAYSLPKQMMF